MKKELRSFQETAFATAVENGQIDVVRSILEHGANIDEMNRA